jgi:hypothetical protein
MLFGHNVILLQIDSPEPGSCGLFGEREQPSVQQAVAQLARSGSHVFRGLTHPIRLLPRSRQEEARITICAAAAAQLVRAACASLADRREFEQLPGAVALTGSQANYQETPRVGSLLTCDDSATGTPDNFVAVLAQLPVGLPSRVDRTPGNLR